MTAMKKLIPFVLLLLSVTVCSAQQPATQQRKSKKLFTSVPEQLSLQEFIPLWFDKSEPTKSDRHLVVTKKDDSFYYFSHAFARGTLRYKVTRKVLEQIHFDNVHVRTIKERFIKEMIPETDKQQGNWNNKCTSASDDTHFKYSYAEENNTMHMEVRWKVTCDLKTTLIDKTYHASYNFDTGQFVAR